MTIIREGNAARLSVHVFHATDFVNTSFSVFYRKKFTKIDPFLVTK